MKGKKSPLGTCFLFAGPEIGERQDAVESIRRDLAQDCGRPAEEISFYAGEKPFSDIVAVLRNSSLFSEARLIQIKEAESIKKQDEAELLVSYIKAPLGDTTLILVSDQTSIDKRIEAALPKENKRIFWELFENRKIDWIRNFFKREGYAIDSEGIDAMLGLVENNTDALRREGSRLMLFLGKEKTIGASSVEKWLSHSRQESAFTLFSRISEGELEKSLQTLANLLAGKESPQAILASLSWCFHRLRDYKNLIRSSRGSEPDFKKIGLGSSKVRRDYEQASDRYSPAQLDRAIALLARYDFLTRANSAMSHILLDLLLYKIIAAR